MAGMKRTAAIAAALAIMTTPVANAAEFVPGVTDFGRGGAQSSEYVPGVTDFPRTGAPAREAPAFPSSGGDGIVGDELAAGAAAAALAAALVVSGVAVRRRHAAGA